MSNAETEQLNIGGVNHRYFTEDDFDSCWIYYKQYLLDILNDIIKLKMRNQTWLV